MGAESISSGKVAYKVRFENTIVPGQTRICYMTEGSLLRDATVSPDLSRYSLIILDEAHERTVDMEFLFGVLKRASTQRLLTKNPLKVNPQISYAVMRMVQFLFPSDNLTCRHSA